MLKVPNENGTRDESQLWTKTKADEVGIQGHGIACSVLQSNDLGHTVWFGLVWFFISDKFLSDITELLCRSRNVSPDDGTSMGRYTDRPGYNCRLWWLGLNAHIFCRYQSFYTFLLFFCGFFKDGFLLILRCIQINILQCDGWHASCLHSVELYQRQTSIRLRDTFRFIL